MGTTIIHRDQAGIVHSSLEHRGLGAFLSRSVKRLLGYRSYDLTRCLQADSKGDTTLETTQRKTLRERVAKQAHLSSNIAGALFDISKLPEGERDQALVIFIKGQNPKMLASAIKALKVYRKALAPESTESKVVKRLEEISKVHSRWTELGLKADWLETNLKDIEFLVSTRLIFSIVGYQNSSAAGAEEHKLWRNASGQIMIKKQGSLWISVDEIRRDFDVNDVEHCLELKANKLERWNYFHQGLVPQERFYQHHLADPTSPDYDPKYPQENATLKPILQLSRLEMHRLTAHAQTFHDDVDPSRTCVLQFFTHPRPSFDPKGMGRNLDAQASLEPQHCSVRIIDADGNVYSTGLDFTNKEEEFYHGDKTFLAAVNAQPAQMDFEEFRPHQGRITTSIAIAPDRFQAILEMLNRSRKQTIRYSMLRQNCISFGTRIAELAGIGKINTRISLGTMLYRALPDIQQIPLIGPLLYPFVRIGKKVIHLVDAITPNCVKTVFRFLKNIVLFIPSRLGALLKNLLIIALGGTIASPRFQGHESAHDGFDDFSILLGSMFSHNSSYINHSSVFVHWQLQQKSTVVHEYKKGRPSMSILPPQETEAKEYSDKRKAEFQTLYQYSTPVGTAKKPTQPTRAKTTTRTRCAPTERTCLRMPSLRRAA